MDRKSVGFGIDAETLGAGNASPSECSSLCKTSAYDLDSTKPSLLNKRSRYLIIHKGCNVTPVDLTSDKYNNMGINKLHQAFEPKIKLRSEAFLGRAKSILCSANLTNYRTAVSLDDIKIDTSINTEEGIYENDEDLDVAPSALRLAFTDPPTMYPKVVNLVFKETETISLFDLQMYSYTKGTPEGDFIEEETEEYNYLTIGKGRNRKTIVAEAQTEPTMSQSRYTLKEKPAKKNVAVLASAWDMHDTYIRLNADRNKEEEDEMVLFKKIDPLFFRKKIRKSKQKKHVYETVEELLTLASFRNAVMIMERLLASSAYKQQQRKLRGLIEVSPLSLDLKYQYTCNMLWTYSSAETDNHCLMCFVFNPVNEDIIACGYGKYYYAEQKKGLVCIWCTKNPKSFERIYRFDYPVTSVIFLERNPNWLACGFYSGEVMLLDITSYEKKIIAQSDRMINPCFEPIWKIKSIIDESSNREVFITICQDGRINKFFLKETCQFSTFALMMRLTQVEMNLFGVYKERPCVKRGIQIKRNPVVLCVTEHPQLKHIYYIGTDEGCIHKCSTHYNQHLEVFRAHGGPVYAFIFSKNWDVFGITCGADFYIRFWLVNIEEPIWEVACSSTVYGVCFCPKNETILISISDNLLHIWDLRRKIYEPSSEYKFDSGIKLTNIKFSPSGNTMFVSASDGRLYTIYLEDMPIPPFDQKSILKEIVWGMVKPKPHLKEQVMKMDLSSKFI